MSSEHAGGLRLVIFVVTLLLFGIAENFFPQRKRTTSQLFRWVNNLTLVSLNSILLRFLLPLTAVSMAELCQHYRWGLFQQLDWPYWIKFSLCLLVLDLTVYLQHLVFHQVPFLWRLHRIHHVDHDVDVTTGLRFHPIEILLSMGIKIGVVIALGAPVWAVFWFEVILNAMAMFNHSNLALPQRLDALLRRIVVTPDMHRVHHSIRTSEQHHNYGFNLSCWDFLLRTYQKASVDGAEQMEIGVKSFESCTSSRIDQMLVNPFK